MTTEPDRTRPLLRWLTAIDLPQRVLLGCADAAFGYVPPDAAAVRLDGCVADVSIGLPAQLLACGVASVGVLPCVSRPDACAQQVAGWSAVLPDVGTAEPLAPPQRLWPHAMGPVFEVGTPQLSRRFAFGLQAACRLPFELTDEEPQRVVAALRILSERGRVRFGGPEPDAGPGEPDITPDPVTSAVALLASGCVVCGVCVRACPHGALDLRNESVASVLVQVPQRCAGEMACVQLCPQDALSVAGPLSLFDVARTPSIELASVATSTCRRCGVRHPASEGQWCPTCAFRIDNAFGHVTSPPR